MKNVLSLFLLTFFCFNIFSGRDQAQNFHWNTSAPSSEGLNPAVIDSIDPYIKRVYPNLYSFMLIRNDKIVCEKYYQGHTEDQFVPVYSVTKSVISALVGAALNRGFISSINDKAEKYLPELFNGISDTAKKNITVYNCLTLTAGLETSDKSVKDFLSSKNLLKYTIDRPVEGKRNKTFSYNSGLINILSGIITKATGMSTKAFATQVIFKPLGITNFKWSKDPQGLYTGGWGLALRPRDLAKFGLLYLHKGNWQGRQLVPVKWIKESSVSHVRADSINGYGYCWWVNEVNDTVHNKLVHTFSARGARNQRLVVIPSLNIVMVITANPALFPPPDGSDPESLIGKFVLPAVKE